MQGTGYVMRRQALDSAGGYVGGFAVVSSHTCLLASPVAQLQDLRRTCAACTPWSEQDGCKVCVLSYVCFPVSTVLCSVGRTLERPSHWPFLAAFVFTYASSPVILHKQT
eukprot:scaffold195852_cov22-Tisochrysis_lutea.AAC.1